MPYIIEAREIRELLFQDFIDISNSVDGVFHRLSTIIYNVILQLKRIKCLLNKVNEETSNFFEIFKRILSILCQIHVLKYDIMKIVN